MPEIQNFRDRVDLLMKAQKMISGEPSWQRGLCDGAFRWAAPLSIDGVTTGMKLCVDSYPRLPYIEFHLNVIYEKSVSRLDFSEIDRHNNHAVKGVLTPPNVPLGMLLGSHFHGWAENRMLANATSGPKELEFAIGLPAGVRSYDSAFRFFCGQCNIVVVANVMPPDLPPRDLIV